MLKLNCSQIQTCSKLLVNKQKTKKKTKKNFSAVTKENTSKYKVSCWMSKHRVIFQTLLWQQLVHFAQSISAFSDAVDRVFIFARLRCHLQFNVIVRTVSQ